MASNKKLNARAAKEARRKAQLKRQRMAWAGGIGVGILVLGALLFWPGGGNDDVGTIAPEFTLPAFEGDLIKLSDYRGKPVAVTFMHTW